MRKHAITLCLLALVLTSPSTADPVCPGGELVVHHDMTLETGYCWEATHPGGTQPPYYGSFGEAYDLGPGEVRCGAFWVCQSGYMIQVPNDFYVWDGGVTREPGDVLAFVPEIEWGGVAHYPDFNEHDIEFGVHITDEFTIGVWMPWDGWCNEFLGADLDGLGGHPWTCIAPGLEWPSGWQDPSIVFGLTRSLGIGVYFTRDPTSAASGTWGEVKTLFR